MRIIRISVLNRLIKNKITGEKMKIEIKDNEEYSFKIGLIKTLKNVAVMFGVPAVLYVLANISTLVPQNMMPIAVPIAGAITYFIKNYVENKGKA